MEQWRSINNFNRYMVSDLGNVKSLNYRRTGKEKVLKQTINNGYKVVCLGNSSKMCKVHRLVAEAFIPNPLNKTVVLHKNRNTLDNRADNLEWVGRDVPANIHFEKIKNKEKQNAGSEKSYT